MKETPEEHPWYAEDPHAYLCPPKILADGRTIWVLRMLFNARLCLAPHPMSITFVDVWCYHSRELAVEAALEWDGNGEPRGWNKHPASGRYRPENPLVEYAR